MSECDDQAEMKAIGLWNRLRHLQYHTPINVPVYEPCFCVGPQNGEPLCRCKMKNIIVRDGRYIEPERDLGPVRA